MTQDVKSRRAVGKKGRHESIRTANFDTWSGGLGCDESRLSLELHVQAQRRDENRPTVAVVARIVDVLQSKCRIDAAPRVKRVVGFNNIFTAVVQAAIP